MTKLILFNKPYNVVSQFTGGAAEETLAGYIKMPDFYAAGRLDKNSEGLLLLTNDGALNQRLTNPKYNKKKYYWVQVEGVPTEEALEPLHKGLKSRGISYLPAEVKKIDEPPLWPRIPPIRERKNLPTSWLEIILREGKNHQVRKMTAAAGFPTLRLVRHKIDLWDITGLRPGEYKVIDV